MIAPSRSTWPSSSLAGYSSRCCKVAVILNSAKLLRLSAIQTEPSGPMQTSVQALTLTVVEILRLVAAGNSNKTFGRWIARIGPR